MRRRSYPKLTSEQLVDEYIAIGSAQDTAIENFDNRTYNRLYPQREGIAGELKSRSGDQRSLLFPLLQHPNWQAEKGARTLSRRGSGDTGGHLQIEAFPACGRRRNVPLGVG